ncbi:DUF2971 domain-containing protein [Litoribacillus peritrichatus]|uniref:DUF2971 domain-containing protein n=1 Tax=Litoribacillus peritrichatus TaxID=718191 RepID=A0ABP7M550_9GAMM
MSSIPALLYKFADLETANKIITSKKLRWIAPSELPEPFAVNSAKSLMIKDDVLTEALAKFVANMIFTHSLPFKDTSNPIVKAIIRWRSTERFDSEEEARGVLTDLLQSTILNQQEKNQEMLEHWDFYLSHLRLLCLGDKPDNLALWQHHADNHCGVAFGFEVNAAHDDGAPQNPNKVKYGEQRPVLTDMRAQIEHIMGIRRLDPKTMFSGQFLVKSKSFIAEQEWRCLRTLSEVQVTQSEQTKYTDYTFNGDSLKRVYLGAALSPDNRIKIMNTIKESFPETDIYSCSPNMNQFTLKIEKIYSAQS